MSRIAGDTDAARRWLDRLIENTVGNFAGHSIRVERSLGGLEDVELHKVGRNATHEFWVGILTDGRIVLRTVCEGEWDENGDPTTETTIWIYKPGEVPTYLGHW